MIKVMNNNVLQENIHLYTNYKNKTFTKLEKHTSQTHLYRLYQHCTKSSKSLDSAHYPASRLPVNQTLNRQTCTNLSLDRVRSDWELHFTT